MKYIKRLKIKSDKVLLSPLSECSSDMIEQLRVIRNIPEIRDNMYTNHEITTDEHVKWAAKQKNSKTEKFYAVIYDEVLSGGASVNKIDNSNKRAEWAFYLNPGMQGKGLGAALEYKMIDLCFTKLGLNKLDCEVLEFNEAVISMHKRFGFSEEGCRRERVIRNGKSIDSILLGITKKEWITITNQA